MVHDVFAGGGSDGVAGPSAGADDDAEVDHATTTKEALPVARTESERETEPPWFETGQETHV